MLSFVIAVSIFLSIVTVERTSSVHRNILQNTIRFSTAIIQDLDATSSDQDAVRIVCPKQSDGCLINDVVISEDSGVGSLEIDQATFTANSLDGGPPFQLFTDNQVISANEENFLNNLSGISMAGGDTIDIETTGAGSTDYDVQVMGRVEGAAKDFGIDAI